MEMNALHVKGRIALFVHHPRCSIQSLNGILSISELNVFNLVGGQYSSNQTSQAYSDSTTKQIGLINDTLFATPSQIYQIRFPNKDITVSTLNLSTVNFS
jgi:hypothetical protein